jgi:hypothetical protein
MTAGNWTSVRQCSFSAIDAAQFMLARDIHNRNHLGSMADYNEVMLETWSKPEDTENPKKERLAIEAFYWRTSAPATLGYAQGYQQEYKAIYNRIVPVVRLSFAQQRPLFEYNDADQRLRP